MNWSQSYTAAWRVFRVNRDTWADSDKLADVDSVSITRTADGSLLESGAIELSGDFQNGHYRIVMTAIQGSEVERVDVATLLFNSEGGSHNYGNTAHSANGYSVLYPASVTAVTTGEYAPAGVDGVQYAKELLESSINAPVETEGGFELNEHLVHELGSSILDAVWTVLDAGKYVMQIDGRGVVHIRPKPTEPSLVIDNSSRGLVMNGIEYSSDISQIPNRYIVITDNNITVASNDSRVSESSTVNVGYKVDVVDTSPTPINGQTYAEYARAKLEEMSVLKKTRTYTREYAPDVYPYSIVRASISGMTGDLRVESQTINCGNGITVSEKASEEVKLWTAM